jgi:rhamnosyltransferase
MTSSPDPSPTGPAVHAVVVTYSPDLDALGALLAALTDQVAATWVIDNGPGAPGLATLAGRHGARLHALGHNAGIARAQNVGIELALDEGATHVLLADQDSVPGSAMVDELLAGIDRGERQGRGPVGAVGPLAGDVRSGSEELVYVARRWGPRRAGPGVVDADGLVEAAFLIASGCLVPADVLREVGPMWGLRARRGGYRLLAVTAARLDHSLGDRLVKIPGRAQEVHVHSPVRTYYLARNTILLLRSGLLPPAWRVGYAVWLAKYAAFNVVAVPGRIERARRMMRGVADGLLRRTGPAAS